MSIVILALTLASAAITSLGETIRHKWWSLFLLMGSTFGYWGVLTFNGRLANPVAIFILDQLWNAANTVITLVLFRVFYPEKFEKLPPMGWVWIGIGTFLIAAGIRALWHVQATYFE
jgi:hypothetical protein